MGAVRVGRYGGPGSSIVFGGTALQRRRREMARPMVISNGYAAAVAATVTSAFEAQADKRLAAQTGILTKEPDHPPQEC